MMGQTLTIVREWENREAPLPVFFCGECGDLMVFALVASASNDTREAFEKLRLVCAVKDQKPRFCPMCGTKNKRQG